MSKAIVVRIGAARDKAAGKRPIRVPSRSGVQELGQVIDVLPGIVWTALPDGRIVFFNDRWRDYTGLMLADSCGWQWQAAVHPEDLPELLNRWRSIFDSGQPGEIEARLRGWNGSYRWFLIRTCPVKDAFGQVVEWYGINTDIEDQRRAFESRYARWWLCPTAREHHFREVGDKVAALFVLTSPAGEAVAFNRHVLDYFGATPDEMKGRPIAETVHPDDRAKFIETWERAVSTGGIYATKARHLRKDGIYRWFNVRPMPLRDVEGRIAFWYFLQTDIDDQHRAENLVATENQLLEMVATGCPLPVVLDALCRFVDTTAEGCLGNLLLLDGTKVAEAVGPGLPPGLNRVLEGQALNSEEGPHGWAASQMTQVIVSDLGADTRWKADGWMASALACGLKSCWCSPVSSLKGELLGVLAIYRRDAVSPEPFHHALLGQFTHIASIAIERTRSEGALRRSEAFLTQAQHLSLTGSFSWRVATEEIVWSEEVYRIFELDPAVPLTNELIYSRIHPDDVPGVAEQWARARRGEALDYNYEYRLQMADGTIKYLHTVALGTRDPDGRLEYIGAVQDVTQQRLSEEALGKIRAELARVSKVTSLGALTASIAHEVNQPLSGIITNAGTCLRMLHAEPADVEGARETARRTIRDGQRASEVITRLRALFSNKGVTNEPVDLNEATREIIALSRSELQRSQVLLRQELAQPLPHVTGDRVQLQQVILNLLLNALEAMVGIDGRLKQVVIRTEIAEGDEVRLSVQDSGIGIQPQDAARLFDAFYTTKTTGMGIGLSVSRSIVERHGGRLWAASNEGPGATFSFSIPCASGKSGGT